MNRLFSRIFLAMLIVTIISLIAVPLAQSFLTQRTINELAPEFREMLEQRTRPPRPTEFFSPSNRPNNNRPDGNRPNNNRPDNNRPDDNRANNNRPQQGLNQRNNNQRNNNRDENNRQSNQNSNNQNSSELFGLVPPPLRPTGVPEGSRALFPPSPSPALRPPALPPSAFAIQLDGSNFGIAANSIVSQVDTVDFQELLTSPPLQRQLANALQGNAIPLLQDDDLDEKLFSFVGSYRRSIRQGVIAGILIASLASILLAAWLARAL